MSKRINLAGAIFTAFTVLVALLLMSATPVLADEGKDESGKQSEQSQANDESAKNEAEAEQESAKDEAKDDEANDEQEASTDQGGDDTGKSNSQPQSSNSDDGDEGRDSRGSSSDDASKAEATGGSQTGQSNVETNPASEEGSCPGGIAFKIDNLRSGGTFGPITISNFTMTGFDWSSTTNVPSVLVKDGGGVKVNAGGTSGHASSFGQDISHVVFCLGGEVLAAVDENDEDTVLKKGEKRPSRPEDEVLGTREFAAPQSEVVAARPAVQGAALPFTGVNVIVLIALGLGLIAAGTVMAGVR